MALDPARILNILARHDVDYIVIGGIGAVLHGSPTLTEDLDIVPDLKKTNLDRLAQALKEMNARLMSHAAPDGIPFEFTGKDLQRLIVDLRFLNLITSYGQLDIIHRPEGYSGYRELAAPAKSLKLGDIEVHVAALEDIIRSKQAVARERDLEQLPTLRLLLEATRAPLRPGQEVLVPWELEEITGTIASIHGSGPRATVMVRVRIPSGGEEEIPFPLSALRPAPGEG